MLNQNQTFLQRYFPGLLETVQQDTSTSLFDDIQMLQGKRGLPTLLVKNEDESHYLHSQYNPQMEAERWAASAPVQKKGIVCIIGWGLGYHGIEWMKQHGKNTAVVIIIEPEPRFFLESLSTIDLQPLTNASRVEIITGLHPETIHASLMKLMDVYLTCDLHIHLSPFAEIYPESAFLTIKHEIQRFHDAKQRILQHMADMGELCQTHIVQNIPAMLSSVFPRQIRHQLKGEPAIIVAAGPSLDNNIHQLIPLQNQAWIFAVDTSARVLLQQGIQPHFIVTKDPTELNARHFDELQIPHNTIIMFDPQIPHEILSNRNNKLLCMPNRNHALHSYLSGLELTQDDELPLSNNVALAAFNVAVAAGCSPIIFMGLDLCFSQGSSHAAGTALQSVVEITGDGHTMKYTRGDASDTVSTLFVEGIDGQMHPTTPNFMDALRLVEKLIKQSGVLSVDASEGGAKIAGTTIMTLQDAAAQYCQAPVALAEWLEISSPRRDIPALQNSLETIAAHLEHCDLTAFQALEQIEQQDAVALCKIEQCKTKIEADFQVYPVLQSALERLIVEINQPDYWSNEFNTPEQIQQKYQKYFTIIQETCKLFAPLYHQVSRTLSHENPVS